MQFAEGKDTFKLRIVDDHSAHSGVGDCIVADEDHIRLPKIARCGSMVYQRAVRIVRDLCAATPAPAPGPTVVDSTEIRTLIHNVLRAMNLSPADR